jgi:hypothetical protein
MAIQNASGAASWRGADEAIQSIYNIVKAPLGWSIYTATASSSAGFTGQKKPLSKPQPLRPCSLFAMAQGFKSTSPAQARKVIPGNPFLHHPALGD